jgi:hypothetical protein
MSFSKRAKVACLPDCELVKIDLSECDWLRLHDRQLQVVDSIIVLDLDRKRVDRHAENVAEEPYLARRVRHDGLCRQDICLFDLGLFAKKCHIGFALDGFLWAFQRGQ